MIEDGQLLGEHGRVAERRGQDADPERLAGNTVGERGEKRDGLEARPPDRIARVVEVIVEPDGFEHVVLADPRPVGVERGPVGVLLGRLDADPVRRRAAHRTWSPAAMRGPVVTAPLAAEPTCAAYFAMTPPR